MYVALITVQLYVLLWTRKMHRGNHILSYFAHTHAHTLGSVCSLEGFRDPENPHSSQVNSGVEGEAGRIGKAVFRAPLGTWKVIAF